MNRRIVLAVLAVLGVILGVAALASASQPTGTDVLWYDPFPNPGDQVAGASASLNRNNAGATVRVQTTGLTAGHGYTLWWVIFNSPGRCAGLPCHLGDLGTPEAQAEIVYASGHFVGGSGKGNFSAHLPAGETPGGWFGNGFSNPNGAEIHALVHDHGPRIPELASEMISTYRGGCMDDDVINPGLPPAGYNDGTPGPNSCSTVQVAIFES